MTTVTTDKSVELIDISDDDCSSVVSQPTSDIVIIEEVDFHNVQEINDRSSKRKRRTKPIDIYFTSASADSSKLVTPLPCDNTPIAGVVTSENNGDIESNQISVSPGTSLLSGSRFHPEGISLTIKEIPAIVNKPSDTLHDEENVNDGFLRKENNEEKMKETDSQKKMVNEEEWGCNTCYPPVHTCKKFASVLGNSQSTDNISKRNVFLPKNDFECDVCLKEYSCRNSLIRHRLTHSDPGTWKECPFCFYKTPDINALKVHLRKHLTARPKRKTFSPKNIKAFWNCTYCHKKFQLGTRCEKHELCCEKEIKPSLNPGLLTSVVEGRRMSLRKLS